MPIALTGVEMECDVNEARPFFFLFLFFFCLCAKRAFHGSRREECACVCVCGARQKKVHFTILFRLSEDRLKTYGIIYVLTCLPAEDKQTGKVGK